MSKSTRIVELVHMLGGRRSRPVSEIAEKLRSHPRSAGLAVLALITILPAQAAENPPPWAKALDNGHEALERGAYGQALRFFEKAGKAMPSPSYTVLIGKAQANRCLGYARQSAADAQQAYSLTEDGFEMARAASLVGLAFLETRPWSGNAGKAAVFPRSRLEQASSLFEEALELSDDQYPTAYYYLGKAHLQMGNLQAAADSFESYIASSDPQTIDKSREYLGRIEIARALYVEVGLGATSDSSPRQAAPPAITYPVKINAPRPKYPGMAKRLGVQGTVLVHAIIDEEGRVQKPVVLEGLHPQLDRDAVETTRLWKFEPAKLNGQPVAVVFTLNIEYQLPVRQRTISGCVPIP